MWIIPIGSKLSLCPFPITSRRNDLVIIVIGIQHERINNATAYQTSRTKHQNALAIKVLQVQTVGEEREYISLVRTQSYI